MYNATSRDKPLPAPSFLKSHSHFDEGVLKNLEILRGGIESIKPRSQKQKKAKDLIKLAFSSILIESSNLKRSPCLGYCKHKEIYDTAPFVLLNQKIYNIADDLNIIHSQYREFMHTPSKVVLANAMEFRHRNKFDLVVTSPPYMNGLDYVINYKIETGWLGFVNDHKHLKRVKDEMVVCDNVSKELVRQFSQSKSAYTNDWIEEIKVNIAKSITRRGSYRRKDMPHIVHKYFDDLYKVMRNVVSSLNPGGRFILVIGDSLIADVYVPTDLLIAKIGSDLGLKIEKVEKARERRSGQIRSYRLRESIITLLKR